MALVVGTNCGLCASAPSADPAGSNYIIDNYGRSVKIAVGATPITINEIGWWCDTATEAANFEVGIYSHNAGTDKPDSLLEVSRTNAKGTSAGWKKRGGLSWSLSANTTYWLAVQCDDTATTTNVNYGSITGQRYSYNTNMVTLPDTWTDTGTSSNTMLSIYGVYEESGSYGSSGNSSVYIKDGEGTWQEFTGYEYFKVIKKQNQVSDFEISIMDVESAEKAYVKEFAEVMFLSESNLVLKGRIQKVTYSTAYECTATGYGREAVLIDKELTQNDNTSAVWDDAKRGQWTNISAQTIAKEILSSNTNGSIPWIMQPNTTGLFATDYGDISMRYEYANRLNALAKLTEAINYEWGVSQSGSEYETDLFDLADYLPTTTRATVSQETFAITGESANCSQTAKEKDITNLVNKIDFLGYGDGINQLHTSTYNASETYSTLSADITSTSTTISLADASDFDISGTIRIMEEQITYTGKTGNDLTGCTRGANSTIARAHKKIVYVEKYIAIGSAEAGSSIGTNGLMDYTIIDRDIINMETAELIASQDLLKKMDPIIRIRVIPNEPLETAGSRKIGDLITIIDAESDISDDYRIVGMTYLSEYGDLSLEIEASNRTLTFIEQMKKQKEAQENLSRYMQGATNIYAIGEAENCDGSKYLNMRFYLPADAVAINSVKLNFKLKDYRVYSKSITSAPVFSQNMGGWYSEGRAFMRGNFITTSSIVRNLSLESSSGFIRNMSPGYSSGFFRGTGTWYTYDPDVFVSDKDASGHITSWWNIDAQKDFIANTGSLYEKSCVTSVSGSFQSVLDDYSYYTCTAVTGWTQTSWSYPLGIKTLAPNVSGTFDRIKISFTVVNGYNETKTPTILLKRDGITIETYYPTLTAWSGETFEYEDTTDYRGSTYAIEIGSSGFNVNHTTSPDHSSIFINVATYIKSVDDLDFGIYEEELTSPSVDVYVGEDEGSMTKKGTYTEDQTNLDITSLVSAVGTGKWINLQFRPNKRMRIESNSYIKIFVESKT